MQLMVCYLQMSERMELSRKEYLKLAEADFEVVLWVWRRYPDFLLTLLRYLEGVYREKYVEINIDKIVDELKDFNQIFPEASDN